MTLGIQPEMIQCQEKVSDWEEAIRLAAQPLLANGFIREGYIDAMIATVRELGPYIVIAPLIALPHARSADALKPGLAVLKLEQPVSFGPDADAVLILALSVIDDNAHLEMLQKLAFLLSDEQLNQQLLSCNDLAQLFQLLSTEIDMDAPC